MSSPRRPSLLDLGPRAAASFAGVYALLQLAAVSWGLRAPDHVLGFQMFNESSRITLHLFRELERKRGRVLLPVPSGVWQALDQNGKRRSFAWQDRVRYPALASLESPVHASYGLDAQLFRLQAALDDVARHTPADTETKALVALIEAQRNGRPPVLVRLRAERLP
jgi:hypothetical protein